MKRDAVFFIDNNAKKRDAIYFKDESVSKNAIYFWEDNTEELEDEQLNTEKCEKAMVPLQNQQNTAGNLGIVKDERIEESLAQSNFTIRPIKKINVLNRDGTEREDESWFILEVIFEIKGKKIVQRMEIKTYDLESVIKVIKKKYSFAVAGSRVEEMINDLRIDTYGIPEENICMDAGWNKIKGEWRYCFKGLIIPGYDNRINLKMEVNHSKGLADDSKILSDALNLYREPGSGSILVLYSLLGLLYKVFDEAGYPPRFLLFIKGQTGSFKTAIAKVLYMQLVQEGYEDIPRRLDQDTETALERGLILNGVDTVTLFDDYRPARNNSQEIKLQNNIEMVIRMVGDGASKNRSNSNLQDVRGEGVKGCVVVTGELKSDGHSSNLRCLFVGIKKEEVDIERLSRLQADKSAYTTLLWRFTEFVSANWNDLIAMIRMDYQTLRLKYSREIREARLVDAMVTLHVVMDFLQMFCKHILRWSDAQIVFLEKARKGMLAIVKVNDDECIEKDPIDLFMSGLQYLVVNKYIKLAKKTDKSEVKISSDGIDEGEYLYLKPQNIYTAVYKHLKGMGIALGISYSNLFSKLMEKKIICETGNGEGRVRPYFRRVIDEQNRVVFIKMRREIIFDEE